MLKIATASIRSITSIFVIPLGRLNVFFDKDPFFTCWHILQENAKKKKNKAVENEFTNADQLLLPGNHQLGSIHTKTVKKMTWVFTELYYMCLCNNIHVM